MSEASSPNPSEKPKGSWKERYEQGGEFGANRRKREEEAKEAAETKEEQVEVGIDGNPLPGGEQRELYDRIIASKINNPDARLRERASEWGLNYGQRVKMSESDFRALEAEAEREIGRIEAKQQADKNAEAAATRERAYQQEMADFRSEGNLYNTLLEAALAQLPEPELTSTDPLERHYEQQQVQAARKEEAKRIAEEALEQFKASRNKNQETVGSDLPEPAPEPKKEPGEPGNFDDAEETQQIPQSVINNLDNQAQPQPDNEWDRPTPPKHDLPDIDYSTVGFPKEDEPARPSLLNDELFDNEPGNNEHEPWKDGRSYYSDREMEEKVGKLNRRDRKLLEAADELYNVVQEMGEEFTDEERELIKDAEWILERATKNPTAWQRFKEKAKKKVKDWVDREGEQDEFYDDEEENQPGSSEKKKFWRRATKVGGAALGFAGILGLAYLASKGFGTNEISGLAVKAPDVGSPISPDNFVPSGGNDALPLGGSEFSEAAQMAERGEGWLKTIRESTGIENPKQLDTVLKAVGPDLVRMGQAYPASELGGYGISRPGRISDEALRLIHEEARRRGYIG